MKFLLVVWCFLLALLIGIQIGGFFVAAPAIFSEVGNTLVDSSEAGSIAGVVFHRVNLIALPVILFATSLPLLLRGATLLKGCQIIPTLLLAAALLLLLLDMIYFTREIHRLRIELGDLYGSVSAAPATEPLRLKFGRLHGLSMLGALLQVLLESAAILIVLCKSIPSRGTPVAES